MSKDFFSQDVIQKNGVFLALFFAYLFIGLGAQEYYGKEQLHLLINQYYSPFWDEFFKYYTQYSLPLFIGIAFFFIVKNYNYKMGIYLFSSFVLATSIVMFVKRTFFEHGHRPMYYFEIRDIPLHLIEGISKSITYTYPSGHSCNGFLIMLFFSMLVKKNFMLQIIFFFLAFLVAFSRIYASKHFVIDTIGGSALGVFCNIFAFYIFKNIHLPQLEKKITSHK